MRKSSYEEKYSYKYFGLYTDDYAVFFLVLQEYLEKADNIYYKVIFANNFCTSILCGQSLGRFVIMRKMIKKC